jgi:hypothetical protein
VFNSKTKSLDKKIENKFLINDKILSTSFSSGIDSFLLGVDSFDF